MVVIQWTLGKASLQEMSHVCVDVLIGRPFEAMIFVCVPLKEERAIFTDTSQQRKCYEFFSFVIWHIFHDLP